MTTADLPFLGRSDGSELSVERHLISGMVRATMAVRTDRRHVSGVIRPTVAQPADMMSLQKRAAAGGRKRRWLRTAFTHAVRPSEHIIAHISASLINRPDCSLLRAGAGAGDGGVGKFTKLRKVGNRNGSRFNVGALAVEFSKRRELEHNRLTLRTQTIDLLFREPAGANEETFEPHLTALPGLTKNQQVFSVDRMISDRGIAPGHRHVANLALTGIAHGPIGAQLIPIPGRLCAMSARENEDARNTSRGHDAALPLTTKRVVHMLAAIVEAMKLEGPVHRRRLRAGRYQRNPSVWNFR